MAKTLTKDELKQVLIDLLDGSFIEDHMVFADFLTELGNAVALGMGGQVSKVSFTEGDDPGWHVSFSLNENELEFGDIPPLAELLKNYDPEGEL